MKVRLRNHLTLFPLPAKHVSTRSIENKILHFSFISFTSYYVLKHFLRVVGKRDEEVVGSFTYTVQLFFLVFWCCQIFNTNKPTKNTRDCGSATEHPAKSRTPEKT